MIQINSENKLVIVSKYWMKIEDIVFYTYKKIEILMN